MNKGYPTDSCFPTSSRVADKAATKRSCRSKDNSGRTAEKTHLDAWALPTINVVQIQTVAAFLNLFLSSSTKSPVLRTTNAHRAYFFVVKKATIIRLHTGI